MHRRLRWKVIKSFGHWTAEEPISGANKYPNHGSRSHTREILFFFAPSPINLPKVPRIVFTQNYLSQIYVGLYVVWSRGHGAWQGLRIRAGPLVHGPFFLLHNRLGTSFPANSMLWGQMSIIWHCVGYMHIFFCLPILCRDPWVVGDGGAQGFSKLPTKFELT